MPGFMTKVEMHKRRDVNKLRRGRTDRSTYSARCSCGWQGTMRPLWREANDDAAMHSLEHRYGSSGPSGRTHGGRLRPSTAAAARSSAGSPSRTDNAH